VSRLVCIVALGVLLGACVHRYRASRRPRALSRAQSEVGWRQIDEILDIVRASEFGDTPRGKLLVAEAERMLKRRGIRFCPDLVQEALYRREFGCRPMLYISAPLVNGEVRWPDRVTLAQRVFHETLHCVVDSEERSFEEECDAFCAAEEAAAVIEARSPVYPVTRDGETIWVWVQREYANCVPNSRYQPVGCGRDELAARTGIPSS